MAAGWNVSIAQFTVNGATVKIPTFFIPATDFSSASTAIAALTTRVATLEAGTIPGVVDAKLVNNTDGTGLLTFDLPDHSQASVALKITAAPAASHFVMDESKLDGKDTLK